MINQLASLNPNELQQALINRQYGMFIHFGINTFNDTEWSNGKLPIESYNPPVFDADTWVKNALDAGMKYIVLITKHHDGFCLWNTKYTSYCVQNTTNKMDVVKSVSDACKKYGIQLGLYYSLWDRNQPCYSNDLEYVEYMCNQLTELLDGRYGEIVELWLDGGWDKKGKKWNLPKLYDLVHTLQPNCAFSSNVTIGRYNSKGGAVKKYFPEKYKENMPMKYFPSDFRLLDPHFTRPTDPKIYKHCGKKYYLPFEATICIRDMTNWFWDPKYTKDKLVETDFIIQKYKQLIAQDNCLVVNVAPNTMGIQEPADIERLLDVAKELKIGKFAQQTCIVD